MAKIADLPVVASPDGTETVVVLKDSVAKRVALAPLIAPAVAAGATALADVNAARATALADVSASQTTAVAAVDAQEDISVTAITNAGIAAAALAPDVVKIAGLNAAEANVLTTTAGGTAGGASTIASGAVCYGHVDGVLYDGHATEAAVVTNGSCVVKLRIVDIDGIVIYDSGNISFTGSGVHTQTLPRVPVKAGAWAGWLWVSGSGIKYDSANPGRSFTEASYTGAPGDFVTVTAQGTNGVRSSLTVEYDTASLQTQMSILNGRVAAAEGERIAAKRPATSLSGSVNQLTRGLDAGLDLAIGSTIWAVPLTLDIGSTVANIRIQILRVPLSSGTVNSFPTPATTDHRTIQTTYTTPAALGLVSGTPATVFAALNREVRVEEGYSYFVQVSFFTSLWAAAGGTIPSLTSALRATQRSKGWISNAGATSSNDVGIGFALRGPAIRSSDDRIVNCQMVLNGLSVTTTIELQSGGMSSFYTDTRTLTAPTAGKARYDTLRFDRETLTFALYSGGEDGTKADASERLPALTVATELSVANLKVKSGFIYPVETWDIFDGIPRRLQAQFTADEMRNRRFLRKSIKKLSTGGIFRMAVIGDSTAAFQSAAPGAGINGDFRDRACAIAGSSYTYLRDALSDDLVDNTTLFPLYTAVQLGRAADTAGTTHTKFGFMWEFVDDLVRNGGCTLGTNLFYDNIAVAGTTSTNAVTNILTTPVPQANLILAATGNYDLVVVNYGMNNDASIAITLANLIYIGNYLRAAGCEVMFVGRSLKRGGDYDVFEATNRATRQAAYATDCAILDMRPVFSDRYSGMTRIHASDFAAANGNNHSGPNEERAKGRLLARNFR